MSQKVNSNKVIEQPKKALQIDFYTIMVDPWRRGPQANTDSIHVSMSAYSTECGLLLHL